MLYVILLDDMGWWVLGFIPVALILSIICLRMAIRPPSPYDIPARRFRGYLCGIGGIGMTIYLIVKFIIWVINK